MTLVNLSVGSSLTFPSVLIRVSHGFPTPRKSVSFPRNRESQTVHRRDIYKSYKGRQKWSNSQLRILNLMEPMFSQIELNYFQYSSIMHTKTKMNILFKNEMDIANYLEEKNPGRSRSRSRRSRMILAGVGVGVGVS